VPKVGFQRKQLGDKRERVRYGAGGAYTSSSWSSWSGGRLRGPRYTSPSSPVSPSLGGASSLASSGPEEKRTFD
jgi:hypothetical protein